MQKWSIKGLDPFQLNLAKRAHLASGYQCLDGYLRGMAIIMGDQHGGLLREAEPLLDTASEVILTVVERGAFDCSRLVDGLGPETRLTIHRFARGVFAYHEEQWAVALGDDVVDWSNKHGYLLTRQLLFVAYCHRTLQLIPYLSSATSGQTWGDWQNAVDDLQHKYVPALEDRARAGWEMRYGLLTSMSRDEVERFEHYIGALFVRFIEHWQFVQESMGATLYWEYYARRAADGGLAVSS